MKIYTGETRKFLEESFLIRATVLIPRDMRRLNVTKGNIKKQLAPRFIQTNRSKKNLTASLVAPVCWRGWVVERDRD